jgi:hypothetical protein
MLRATMGIMRKISKTKTPTPNTLSADTLKEITAGDALDPVPAVTLPHRGKRG